MSAQALQNAEAALLSLASFLRMPVVDDRDRAGVIQAFEFTFETTGPRGAVGLLNGFDSAVLRARLIQKQ